MFQGSLTSDQLILEFGSDSVVENGDSSELVEPVTAAFQGHFGGQVVDVKFSPFHRNVFLSLGSDREVRFLLSLKHILKVKS